MKQTDNPILGDRFEQALVYASQLHRHQIRKGSGVPYLSHLLSVTALVLEDGGDEEQAIAALLHDAIEDQGGEQTRQEIRDKFGDRVVDIVNGCTDAEVVPKPPWQERKQKYIDKMRHASPQVRRVSMADKLHNARSILADWHRQGDVVWEHFKGGREGTLWYYYSLLAVDREAGSSYLGQELARVIRELEQRD